MAVGIHDQATYRADIFAFLEFCQRHCSLAPLSTRALYLWIAHLEGEGVPIPERNPMRGSVETLFRHVGILPDEQTEQLL